MVAIATRSSFAVRDTQKQRCSNSCACISDFWSGIGYLHTTGTAAFDRKHLVYRMALGRCRNGRFRHDRIACNIQTIFRGIHSAFDIQVDEFLDIHWMLFQYSAVMTIDKVVEIFPVRRECLLTLPAAHDRIQAVTLGVLLLELTPSMGASGMQSSHGGLL